IGDLAAHAQKRGLEVLERRARRHVEGWYRRHRLRGRLVLADPRKNIVTAAHFLLRFLRNHCRNVSCGAAGTSRWRPHAFNRLYIMNRGNRSMPAPVASITVR